MHAYIITGGNRESREKMIADRVASWNINRVDCVILEEEGEHTGISSIRTFQKRLQLVPYQSTHSVGIIRTAERLTVEAQNALLKTLEEPPVHAYIVCEVESPTLLLATIVSRCEIIFCQKNVREQESDEVRASLTKLLSSSTGQKLSLINAIAPDRIEAKAWVERAVIASEQLLRTYTKNLETKTERNKITRLIRLLQTAQKELELNINAKLVLDTVFLSL